VKEQLESKREKTEIDRRQNHPVFPGRRGKGENQDGGDEERSSREEGTRNRNLFIRREGESSKVQQRTSRRGRKGDALARGRVSNSRRKKEEGPRRIG